MIIFIAWTVFFINNYIWDLIKLKNGIKNVFELEMFCIPLHVNKNHWAIAICFMNEKNIEYFDSLGGDCVIAGPLIYCYLSNMSKKFNSNFEFTEWKWEKSTRMPKQTNGYDCGVFMLQCLYQITSYKQLLFTKWYPQIENS